MQSIFMVRLKRPLFIHEPRGPDNEAKITGYNPAKSREQLGVGEENLTLKLWCPRSQAWNPSPLKTARLIQADGWLA